MKDPKKTKSLWEQDSKTAVHVPTSTSQARLKATRSGATWEDDANTTVRPVNVPLPRDAYPDGIDLVASEPPDAVQNEGTPLEPSRRAVTEPPLEAATLAGAPRRRGSRRRRLFTSALRALAFVATAVAFWALGHGFVLHFGSLLPGSAATHQMAD
jgi:hypothetical protein